ncbi:class III extradiol ring-cleavage dioxygenase [Acinetobacter puyangensis]|uniref:4,5-DOPA dioxygenase extradiol n=1 Tax=Acinetobacter puyangensis TaxID=1096779 RepID=A0A240ED71_9GAMM|nr:class III extradiol ring-cleavage dioxygenase [Acinetobacter puyangensis]SNX45855.1 4,5-DOPA dioxygenase extradiol [Acinetobacter puyangensis]
MSLNILPGLFISHGSPMLALQPGQVGAAFERISHNLPKPRAIVVMSAHWEDIVLEVSTATRPKTWHDFRGFPEALYKLQYPAPGEPELAEEIIQRLQDSGFEAHANAMRPRDHGVWMPLLHMYPEADIPVIQISLPKFYTARQIYQLAESLAYLRQQQVLLIGSGSITHNLAELRWQEQSDVPLWASEFRNKVASLLQNSDYEAVLNWKNLPYIQKNHPSLEHLSPLFFAMGTGKRMSVVHSSFSMGTLGMDLYRFD